MDVAPILDRIAATRGRSRTVVPLEGGMTNRNYRVQVGDVGEDVEIYILRLAGTNTACLGIDRECEVACSRAAADLGLGPEVVAFLPEFGALLRRYVPGAILAPEAIRRPEVLRQLADALRRYHDSPAGAGRFCAFKAIRSSYAQACARAVPFPEAIHRALELLDRIEAHLPAGDLCPCHNDLLAANIIESPRGLQIIDWEYAGMGDRFFDLGNLAVNNAFEETEEQRLLEFYFGRVEEAQLRRLRIMRLISDLRESLWGFLQAGLSQLDVDFQAYGRRHLERFLSNAASTVLP